MSHYTSSANADSILAQMVINKFLSDFGQHVYVLLGRSTPRRAASAGASSVEARIVFNAYKAELEDDPALKMRKPGDPAYIAEARWFARSGPVTLDGRNPIKEIPSFWERWFG